MGFTIDTTCNKFDIPVEYLVKFDGDVPVETKISGHTDMTMGITKSEETELELYHEGNSLGKTSLFRPFRGCGPHSKEENTIPNEYLDCVISHLEEIQNNPSVKKNSGYDETYHALNNYVSTLMDFYQSEIKQTPT